jgi:RHS repeat-associated protein
MTAGPLPANVNANSTLIWDGENRLIQAQVTGGATVTFIYDSQSRRIAETVGTVTKITVFDGWNPIAEYSISNNQYSIFKSFTWGMDLSGTLQGAGGVGGLLAVTDSTGTYYPTYDGNGNVSEYLDSTGAVVAHYEYDPFGKTTVASGSKAQDFSHRFSTKPLDLTTGLYYYAYRYYDPATGRWPSRDPIGEEGGINLFAFVGNDGVNQWDYLGMLNNPLPIRPPRPQPNRPPAPAPPAPPQLGFGYLCITTILHRCLGTADQECGCRRSVGIGTGSDPDEEIAKHRARVAAVTDADEKCAPCSAISIQIMGTEAGLTKCILIPMFQ